MPPFRRRWIARTVPLGVFSLHMMRRMLEIFLAMEEFVVSVGKSVYPGVGSRRICLALNDACANAWSIVGGSADSALVMAPVDAHRAAEQADNLNQQVESLNGCIANEPAMDVEDEDIHCVPSPYEPSCEYHPNSGILAQTRTFSMFQRDILEDPPFPDTQPWVPFQSRLDFEAAELAHEAALSQPQIDWLINLLHRSKQDSESFTLYNYKDVRNMWSAIHTHNATAGLSHKNNLTLNSAHNSINVIGASESPIPLSHSTTFPLSTTPVIKSPLQHNMRFALRGWIVKQAS
ncbi:hypothetical protein DEU56DRAFT_908418 [Suillus clintonianus]|uniref:uncharacterized protein n=1 Tax=Suillus clintonianus TaxID=1904413 RepID=UPI001B87C386|nr:uncharacterized protein DEU56DRAFT_908418 [Suillus clintonianus]KAG2150779.1 hypothetical protein DEU56DRAFT_908418 [Suillus clintonianus]